MNSFLLLHQCPAYLFRLIWIVLEMGVDGRTAAALWNIASRICSIPLLVCVIHVSLFLYMLSQ